jgi:hypothetical protein
MRNWYRLLSFGLFPALIGFTWGLSPAINWSSLSVHFSFLFHIPPLFIHFIKKYLSWTFILSLIYNILPFENLHLRLERSHDTTSTNLPSKSWCWVGGPLESFDKRIEICGSKSYPKLSKGCGIDRRWRWPWFSPALQILRWLVYLFSSLILLII